MKTEEQKEKQRQYVRNHYRKNKERYRLKNKRNRQKSRDWFQEYLKDKFCVLCKEPNQCTFDFHHLDPLEKEYNVSTIAGQTYGIETLKKEIEKCVLLCSNCHRKVHAGILNV